MESICGERDLWGKRRQTANRMSRLQYPQPVLQAELSSPNCSCGAGMMWKTADWHWLTQQWMKSHPGCLYPAGNLPVTALRAKLSWWTSLSAQAGQGCTGGCGVLCSTSWAQRDSPLGHHPSKPCKKWPPVPLGAIPTRRFFPQPYSLSATSHQHHSVRVLQNMNKVHVPDSKVLSGLLGQNQEPVGSDNCCLSGHSLTTAECLQGLVYPLSLGCSFSSKD